MPQGPVGLRDVRNATDYVCNITAATAVRTAAAKVVFAIPATVGVYMLDWPVKSGVTIVPASNQVLAVSLA